MPAASVRCLSLTHACAILLLITTSIATVGCSKDSTKADPAKTEPDPKVDQRVTEIVREISDLSNSEEEDEAAKEEQAGKLRRRIVAIGPKAVPSLVKLLDNEDLRGSAMQVLADFGPKARPAAPKLLEILRNDDDFISFDRLHANQALEKTGGDPAVLAASLASENGNERMGALRAAQGMGKDMVPLLPNLMTIVKDSDEDVGVRINTLEALAALGPDAVDVIPDLIGILEETDVYEDSRLKINDEPIIIGSVAAAAADVLGSIGPKAEAALPALEKLATDESEHNREAAKDAIGKIGGG